MIKNIVFDFDGTIANSMEALLGFVNENHHRYGFERVGKKKVRFLMSKGAKYLISYLKIPKYKIPLLMKDIRTQLNKVLEVSKPFKEMPNTLKTLNQSGLTLGILTSNSKENVEKFLKKNRLEYFDFIYHGSSLFGKDKMIKKMIKEQKLNKEETIYVGDEDRDIDAAKKVGLKVVAVTWGFNNKKLLEKSNPDYLVDTPSDLLQIFVKQ